jgi:hypothetical protein
MLWTDRYTSEPYVTQEMQRTLGGRMSVFSGSHLGSRFITLESRENQGWLTEAMVEACDQMSKSPNSDYECAIGDQTFTVRFRHFDPPAFQAEQLNQIGALAPAGFYLATIKLYTIEV